MNIVPIDVDGSEQRRAAETTAGSSLDSAKTAGCELPVAPAAMAAGDPASTCCTGSGFLLPSVGNIAHNLFASVLCVGFRFVSQIFIGSRVLF